MIEVTETFKLEVAHKLESLGGVNSNLHGHTHKVKVTITENEEYLKNQEFVEPGWFYPQAFFRNDVWKVLSKYDHGYLNDWLDVPTAENLAKFIFDELIKDEVFPEFIKLKSVKIYKAGMCVKWMP